MTGIVLPLLSNILPIKKALGQTLRNALDRFRQGVDDMEVEMVRYENMGVNLTQIGLSIAILLNSILTLYFIPTHMMNFMLHAGFFYLNLLLIGIIVGMVFFG